MVPDISSKTENRRYTKSSSFIMALLFTVLCGAASVSLGYFINYFTKGHFVHSTEAALDSEIRYIESLDDQGVIPPQKSRLYIFLNEDGGLPDDIPKSVSRLAEGIIVLITLKTIGAMLLESIHLKVVANCSLGLTSLKFHKISNSCSG